MKRNSIILLLIASCYYQLAFAQLKKTAAENAKPVQFNSAAKAQSAQAFYQTLLQTWCNALLAQQIKDGPDDGGLFSLSHRFVSGRCGDAVYPLLTMYHLTGSKKYKTAALKIFRWSETHVSQPDGSWTNETSGKNDWTGISCFSTIALGETLRHHSDLLTVAEKTMLRNRLRRGGDYILNDITFETGDINYPNSASAALAVCWKVLGDEKYRQRAKEFAAFALQHFTRNNLIWGEGVRGISDTTPKGLRPVDIPYNLEESLANLALYATLTDDKKMLDVVTASLQAHLNFILPDGGLDAGWCSRQYKWTYFGTATGDGPATGFALLKHRDKRFAEAVFRNLTIRQANTHNGLLYGGADLFVRNVPAFTHLTFSNAKGLAAAIDAGLAKTTPCRLPSDSAYGVREWPEASLLQIGLGPWRASVTTNDIASSPKRGGHPMGGALSMLWHTQTGPVAVASMNDYKTYEPTNMQKAIDSNTFCLTPRIEINENGNRFSNLYDSKATSTWFKKGDSIQITINGHLRDYAGKILPEDSSAFEIKYTFKPTSFQMKIHTRAAGSKLVFPVISPADELIISTDNKLAIQKRSSLLTLTSNPSASWDNKRVFNYIPGFEAVSVENKPDENGNAYVHIKIGISKKTMPDKLH